MAPILGSILGMFGGDGMILIILALLLFYGRNLPSVGRSLGKGISEFKKGLKGLEDDVEGSTGTVTRNDSPPVEAPRPPQRIGPAQAPRFDELAKRDEEKAKEEKAKREEEEKKDQDRPRYS